MVNYKNLEDRAVSREKIDVSSTVKALDTTKVSNSDKCFIQFQGRTRLYLDGSTPTTNTGYIMPDEAFLWIQGKLNMGNLKLVRDGDTDSVVEATYYEYIP